MKLRDLREISNVKCHLSLSCLLVETLSMNHSLWFGTYDDLSGLIASEFFLSDWIIKQLSWKKIVDIWAWFSSLVLELKKLTKDSQFTLIDPIVTNQKKFDEAYATSLAFMQKNLELSQKKIAMYELVRQWEQTSALSEFEQYLLTYYGMSRDELRHAFSDTHIDRAIEKMNVGSKFYHDRVLRLQAFDSLSAYQHQYTWITLASSQDNFEKGSFDVAFMTNLLSHVTSPIAFLQKTDSLLIRKWYIIITDYFNIWSLRFLTVAANTWIIKKIGQNDKLVSYKLMRGDIEKITESISQNIFQ